LETQLHRLVALGVALAGVFGMLLPGLALAIVLIEYWLRLTAATLAWLWLMFQIYDTYRQRKWRSVIGNALISIVLAVVIVTMLRR